MTWTDFFEKLFERIFGRFFDVYLNDFLTDFFQSFSKALWVWMSTNENIDLIVEKLNPVGFTGTQRVLKNQSWMLDYVDTFIYDLKLSTVFHIKIWSRKFLKKNGPTKIDGVPTHPQFWGVFLTWYQVIQSQIVVSFLVGMCM